MSVEILLFMPLLTLVLTAIAVHDARTQRIPDALNLTLALGGLTYQALTNVEFQVQHMVFALGMGLLFFAVRCLHYWLTGIRGLGLGDVKMATAGALWFSPLLFPLFLFTASFCALAYASIVQLGKESPSWRRRVPFGPFLALGIVVAFIVETMQK